MTYEEFTRLARRFHGQTLETKIGRRFTIEVDGGIVYVTPKSTGTRRNTSRAVTEDLLERNSRTGSVRPSDYVDVPRNASYCMAVLRLGGWVIVRPPRGDAGGSVTRSSVTQAPPPPGRSSFAPTLRTIRDDTRQPVECDRVGGDMAHWLS